MDGQLIVAKGDNLPIPVEVVVADSNGKETIFDITGYTVLFTAKRKKTDSDDDAVIKATGTVINGAAGQASINIPKEDTEALKPGKYFYDIQITSADEENNLTIINDELIIVQDITNRHSDA